MKSIFYQLQRHRKVQKVRCKYRAYLNTLVRGQLQFLFDQRIEIFVNPIGRYIDFLGEGDTFFDIRVKNRSHDFIIIVNLRGYTVKHPNKGISATAQYSYCLLYTSDAAD